MNDLIRRDVDIERPRLFYTYHQNNSGGWFHGPAQYVIVEAYSSEQADEIAESQGLYFHGVASGQDCDCCGDRWNSASWSDEPTEFPAIYGNPVMDYAQSRYGLSSRGRDDVPLVAIVRYGLDLLVVPDSVTYNDERLKGDVIDRIDP